MSALLSAVFFHVQQETCVIYAPSSRMLCGCSPSSQQRGSKAKCRQTQTQWFLAMLSIQPLIWCKDNPLCQRVERMRWPCHQFTQLGLTAGTCSWGASVEEVATGLYNSSAHRNLALWERKSSGWPCCTSHGFVTLMTASFACDVQR